MEFLVLVVLFWMPPVLILFKNIIWNLHLWHQKQYRLERFYSFIRWDYLPNNRDKNLTLLKFLIFSLTCTLLVSVYASSIGVLLAYVIWSVEIFLLLERIFAGKSEELNLNYRNLIILFLIGLSLAIAIVMLSIPFALIDRSAVNFLVSDPNASAKSIQDIYIYLGLSAILALFLDIASPIVTAFFVFITSPIGWIANKIAVHKLHDRLSRFRNNIIVIAITGSIGKTVTKEFLYKLLKDNFSIVKTSDIYTTVEELSFDITNKINGGTQVLLVELESFKKGEIKNICKVLSPDISIITDIDIQHYGVFKSKKDYIEARLDIIEGTNHNGTVIAPIDNKFILHYLNNFRGEKVGFSFLNKKASKLSELIQVEIYKRSVEGYKFMLKTTDRISEYQTPIHRTSLIHQLVPSIVVAKKLGLNEKSIKEKTNKITDRFTNIFTLEGDEHSLLISSGNPDSNLKGVLAAIDYACNISRKFKHTRIILITDGVSELGKLKKKAYGRLVEKLKDKVSIVITTDPLLHQLFTKSHLNLLTFKAKNTEETIFSARTLLKSGDIIVVEGKDSSQILSSLRSEE
jgi:UDP-N-acetylmuramoyl-tripeptide--D-alanyl-D-alanine ligase